MGKMDPAARLPFPAFSNIFQRRKLSLLLRLINGAALRGKWTVAWKCWSNPSSTGLWQASTTKKVLQLLRPARSLRCQFFLLVYKECGFSASWALALKMLVQCQEKQLTKTNLSCATMGQFGNSAIVIKANWQPLTFSVACYNPSLSPLLFAEFDLKCLIPILFMTLSNLYQVILQV